MLLFTNGKNSIFLCLIDDRQSSQARTRTTLLHPHDLNSSFSFFAVVLSIPASGSPTFHPLAPVLMPPKRVGPWQLEQVKLRLRAGQVARERAAAIRYRQVEDDEREYEREPPRRVHGTERHRGNTSWTECILCVLVVCCLLLVVAVVFLSSLVLSLTALTKQ
jgi:hypothetical protein